MTSPFRFLWRKLFPARREPPGEGPSYRVPLPLQQALREQAEREGRPEAELAGELLARGLELRRQADRHIQAWNGLTAREKQIAALLCQDYTYRQIASALKISPQTVKTHTHGVLIKLGLRNKLELIQALESWDFSEWRQDQ